MEPTASHAGEPMKDRKGRSDLEAVPDRKHEGRQRAFHQSLLLDRRMAHGHHCGCAMPREVAQQMHHVMVVFFRRRETGDDPVEQIGIGAIEQSFEPVDLRVVEAGEITLGKSAEDEITLLCSAMPAPEQQPSCKRRSRSDLL